MEACRSRSRDQSELMCEFWSNLDPDPCNSNSGSFFMQFQLRIWICKKWKFNTPIWLPIFSSLRITTERFFNFVARFGRWHLGKFPWPVGWYWRYLLPRQANANCNDKTWRQSGKNTLYRDGLKSWPALLTKSQAERGRQFTQPRDNFFSSLYQHAAFLITVILR